jgi:hypothetical protein
MTRSRWIAIMVRANIAEFLPLAMAVGVAAAVTVVML